MSVDHRPSISTLGLNRRSLVKTVLYAGGAVAFAGYGRAPGVLAQDNIRLVQWYHQYGEEGTQDAVNTYAQQYTEANPNVEIEIIWQVGDWAAALSALLLTDEGPDVFEVNSVTLDQVEQGQVAPLDDLYDQALREDFGEANLAAATIDGTVYWIKMITDTTGVYYRKSLVEEAGLAAPTTIDELIALSSALDTGRQKGLFLGNDGGLSAALGPLVWSSGADNLTPENTIGFNTPLVATAFTKFKELNDSGSLLLGNTTDWFDPTAFISGAAAMQWCGLWAFPAINEALGDDVGVFAWPSSGEGGTYSTSYGGWGECVNGKSQNLDAAKAYAKWLWIDNAEVQTDWNVGYGFHVPPRASAAETAEALQVGAAADIVSNLNEYGVIFNPLWTPLMNTALLDALTNVVRNDADPAAELDTAEATVQAELNRLLGA